MLIPEGVNFIDFYIAAKKKNIMIQSKFRGVCVGDINGNIVWRVYIMRNGKKTSKRFPFTKEGEILAGQWYNDNNVSVNNNVGIKRGALGRKIKEGLLI